MASTTAKCASFVALIAILTTVYYRQKGDDVLRNHLENVLRGLIRAERKVQLSEGPKVAVGFGACIDYFAKAIDVLDKTGAKPPKTPKHYNSIDTIDELSQVFAYFFEHGAAAERYVSNKTLFDSLVENAVLSKGTYDAIGGNAPAMARRFHMEGCQVLVGGRMTPKLQQSLNPQIKVSGGRVANDDIHMLLEYPRDHVWGKYKSNRANRFIVHSDENNPTLSSLEEFAEELNQFSPTLLVVSALQMLDNFPFAPGARRSRLEQLESLLTDTLRSTRIHFEMASFAEEACLRDVIETVVYYSDSLGMNEQELPNLHSLLVNDSITLLSDPYPRTATTLDHMRGVWRELRSRTSGKAAQRPITRLHLHTLAYQAIMTEASDLYVFGVSSNEVSKDNVVCSVDFAMTCTYRPQIKVGSSWRHSMSAAAKAALVANRHTCGSHEIEVNKARMLMDDSFSTSGTDPNIATRVQFQPDRPVSCWTETIAHSNGLGRSEVEICIAPVLVCTDVKQTGGGGDNVSSAGLVLQL